jgi:hypothetical protein
MICGAALLGHVIAMICGVCHVIDCVFGDVCGRVIWIWICCTVSTLASNMHVHI